MFSSDVGKVRLKIYFICVVFSLLKQIIILLCIPKHAKYRKNFTETIAFFPT